MSIERFGANPSGPGGRGLPFTKAVRAGDFVFVSGQVPMGPDGDTRDFWPFNKVYNEYFGAALPARSCVRADMMVDCKVEIEVVAYQPAKA